MSEAFQGLVREEGRLIILRSLNEDAGGELNSSLLQRHLESFGVRKTREWLHEELRALAEIGAVYVVKWETIHVAMITAKGRDHVERRIVIEGIKRPSPGA